MADRPQADYSCMGAIIGAHGVRGQVIVKSFTADPETLTEFDEFHLSDGKRLSIRFVGQSPRGFIASIGGVSDRNQAELLRGTELLLPRHLLPKPDEDEFFYDDLIGLSVIDSTGTAIATVKQIVNYGAGDLVEFRTQTGEQQFHAFTKASFPTIDLEGRTITFVAPVVIETDEPPGR